VGIGFEVRPRFTLEENNMKTMQSAAEAAICVTIAENLRAIRRKRGWTQDQLATQSGVSRSTVNRHERLKQRPHADSLLLMARCLNVTLDDICTPKPKRPLSKG
jgi:DNA-binding XRE family transcriptional regulator